jgi:hypothetical protein
MQTTERRETHPVIKSWISGTTHAFASTSTFSLQALALRKACLEMEVPPNFLETGVGEPSSKRFAQTSQNTATAHGGLHTLVWRESRDVPFVRQFPIYEHLIFPVVELWRKKETKTCNMQLL